jgi:hypothetical protein
MGVAMNQPIPEHHSNAETSKEEPIFIFTGKAIVPPRHENGPEQPLSKEEEKSSQSPRVEEPGNP